MSHAISVSHFCPHKTTLSQKSATICRRKQRLSQKSETVRLLQRSATVAEFRCCLAVFGDSRTFLRQCGQGFIMLLLRMTSFWLPIWLIAFLRV